MPGKKTGTGSTRPAVLTIAGSDSSGGAGIQADLKTFTALRCYGTSVITALTAQNTTGVQAVHPVPPEFVEQQICSVLEDIDIRAMKTGMLFDAETIRAIIRALKAHYGGRTRPPLICDPVCVSTSGHTLLQPEAIEVMISELFPLAALITPNKSEAELILSHRNASRTINNVEDMLSAAKDMLALGPRAVLLKGGHVTATTADVDRVTSSHPELRVIHNGLLEDNMEILQNAEPNFEDLPIVVDVLVDSSHTVLYLSPRIDSTSTHGTGCTLAAALTCRLGRGKDVVDATRSAAAFTRHGIETASPIGNGFGPLNHMHSIMPRAIPIATASDPHPLTRRLIQSTASIWKAYVEHDFVKQLGSGTLPRECFLHFIKQDYLYLRYYSRAYGLLAAKSSTFAAIEAATKTIMSIVHEVTTHRSFCVQWGVTEEELHATPESSATTAYGAYMMDVGNKGDTSHLLMAVAACLLGYGEVGLWLKKEAAKPNSWVRLEGNPYLQWIEEYSGHSYQRAVKVGLETLEAMAAADPPTRERYEEWREIWERCAVLERGFWDMALGLL